jgi:hypothetical protein
LTRPISDSPLIQSPSPSTANSASFPLYPPQTVQPPTPTNRSNNDVWLYRNSV